LVPDARSPRRSPRGSGRRRRAGGGWRAPPARAPRRPRRDGGAASRAGRAVAPRRARGDTRW